MSSSLIEVEVRGLLSKQDFERVEDFLKEKSKRKWENNKESTFFVIPNTTLTVSKNLSRHTAKLSYKSEGKKDAEDLEIEFSIPYEASSKAVKIFKNLGFDRVIEENHDTRSYEYNDVEIDLKWSEEWGYNFEMLVVVNKDDQIPDALNKIDEVCEELNIKYMTDKEIREYVSELEKKSK